MTYGMHKLTTIRPLGLDRGAFCIGVVGMSNPRRANGTRRDGVRRWLKAQHRPCWICVAFGKIGTIDYSLPSGHPYSFECDELVPVSKGGSPFARSNVDAAHRCCNQWRGARSVAEVLAIARRSKACAGATTLMEAEKGSNPPMVEPVRGVTSGLSS